MEVFWHCPTLGAWAPKKDFSFILYKKSHVRLLQPGPPYSGRGACPYVLLLLKTAWVLLIWIDIYVFSFQKPCELCWVLSSHSSPHVRKISFRGFTCLSQGGSVRFQTHLFFFQTWGSVLFYHITFHTHHRSP